MENPATSFPRFGPWDGIDETGTGGPTKVRDALNVVFRDGLVMRRPGRCVVALDANGRRVAGLHEAVAASGDRAVVAYLDPAGANAGGFATVNWNTGALADVAGPMTAQPVDAGGSSVAANIDGHLVVAEPGGKLLDYDGTTLVLLTAVDGVDALVGSESYLAQAPTARSLAVWRDRLVAAGAPEAPRLIGLSENKWATANIPDAAVIGGANVWPERTNFDLSTEEGDTVVAVTVIADRLAVFGRAGIAVVDEDAVAPYARIVARQHGCIAPRSVVNIGDRAIYLGEGAIYAFDGSTSIPISGPLRRTMRDMIDWDQAHLAVAVNLRREQEYRIWVPVKGLSGNCLCLVFDYRKGTWRKASHWYLFDVTARRDLTYKFDVTAALAAILENGREVLLTGDSAGRIWLEDVGEDDQAQIFPAFFALHAIDRGAEVETFTDWSIDCVHDGGFVGGIACVDGRTPEQEILRVLDGALAGAEADDIPYVIQRALQPNQQTWPNVAAWPAEVTGPKQDELKLGLRQRARKIQPVILLPGQSGGVVDPGPVGVAALEIGARSRAGRR